MGCDFYSDGLRKTIRTEEAMRAQLEGKSFPIVSSIEGTLDRVEQVREQRAGLCARLTTILHIQGKQIKIDGPLPLEKDDFIRVCVKEPGYYSVPGAPDVLGRPSIQKLEKLLNGKTVWTYDSP